MVFVVLTFRTFAAFFKNATLVFPSSTQSTSVDSVVRDHFHGVPQQNHGFVGRADILEQMELEIVKNRSTKGCRPLALSGLGGMGKTQLMLQYCYLHREEYRYVFWLAVDGSTTAEDSFRRLAQNLGLNDSKEDPKKAIEQVQIWLEQTKGRLILLDNADKDVFRYIPRFGGDVILTTR